VVLDGRGGDESPLKTGCLVACLVRAPALRDERDLPLSDGDATPTQRDRPSAGSPR